MAGFVYIWYDRKYKRYYVGSHWGSEDDGYICSSVWMRNSYNRRPLDFKRRIIARVDDRALLLDEEYRWLSMMKPEELRGVRYYNLHCKTGHWHGSGAEKLNTIRDRMRAAWTPERKAKQSEMMKNRQVSEETRAKMSAKLKGRPATYIPTEEQRQKARETSRRAALADGRRPPSRKGSSISEEHKQIVRSYRHTDEAKSKISAASSRKKSPETRQRMREAALRRVERSGGVAVVRD